MKPHAPLVGALAATFIAGCASLDNKTTPELFEKVTDTGTHIDRPGLPPKPMDQISIERAFRNSSGAMIPDPGQR
jgi:hypothetical protein